MKNLFTNPPRLPLVAPSILSADFMHMGDECRHALEAGADLFHFDVMDGHFVPNLTMGPDLCRCLRAEIPAAFIDVHLMVTDPAKFVDPFLAAGANHLTFHVEVMPPDAARHLAERVRAQGATVGLAINPPTPVDAALDLVPDFDLVLVMSVNPGFSGQRFISEVLDKTRRIQPLLKPTQRLEMDGGVGPRTVEEVRRAGCDVIVAASAVFGVPRSQRASVIRTLRGEE